MLSISYRRKASEELAYIIYQGLKIRQIDTFFDYQSIPAGRWLDTILRQIAARPYFILILAPGTLERCAGPNDVLLREIQEAVMLNRTIIPLITHDFVRADLDAYLPVSLAQTIKEFQQLELPSSMAWIEAVCDRLQDRFLPLISIEVIPTPVSDFELLRDNQAKVDQINFPLASIVEAVPANLAPPAIEMLVDAPDELPALEETSSEPMSPLPDTPPDTLDTLTAVQANPNNLMLDVPDGKAGSVVVHETNPVPDKDAKAGYDVSRHKTVTTPYPSQPNSRYASNRFRIAKWSVGIIGAVVLIVFMAALLISQRPINNNQWTPQFKDFDGVTMALVPSGCFKMGTDNPANQVCFAQQFWIDKTEVTQAQFKQFRGKAAHAPNFTGDNRPVEEISWFEARDFCLKRGARLPSEAEWEYAARGPSDWIYPWGNNWDPNKPIWNTTQTADVDKNNARSSGSWVGAVDLSGHVWEWTSSIYKPYPYNADDGRESTTDANSSRALRGGSWAAYLTDNLRAAVRFDLSPSDFGGNYGFRCTRSFI